MLLSISSWWEQLQSFEKILWTIALLFSFLFLLQTIMSLFAGDADHASGHSDTYIDHDNGIGYQFFTIKNMIAFFTMFGWVALAATSGGLSKGSAILLGLISGSVIVVIMAVVLKYLSQLKHNGVMQTKNAINQTGTTYLFIPAKRTGIGKVHVKVQGTLHELPAMTDDETDIPTGKLIRVKTIINDRILLVTIAENILY
jgi:hypothetical protein